MINFYTESIDKKLIEDFISIYKDSLIAPMDDMWESLTVENSKFYLVYLENNKVGYYSLDDNNYITQFFVLDEFIDFNYNVLVFILKKHGIKNGFISTSDIKSLPIFLDLSKNVNVDTYLYTDNKNIVLKKPFDDLVVKIAADKDLKRAFDYVENSVNLKGDWQWDYLRNLIGKKELFLFLKDDDIIGTGEKRKHDVYGHLGVTVSIKYQGKGLGSYIMSFLKKECYKDNLIPVCSTTVGNISSQKAIKKSGFYAYHRILEIEF